jgi:hypothetical protein
MLNVLVKHLAHASKSFRFAHNSMHQTNFEAAEYAPFLFIRLI